MRLSTKSRYAVTAMLDLALNGRQGPLTLADISEKQNISLSYLEQLFAALRSKGLVRGVRGPGGGYYLGREASDVTVADIICAVDDWVEYTRKNAERNRPEARPLSTRTLWDDLSDQIFDFLDNITLAQMVESGLAREQAEHMLAQRPATLGLRGEAA